MYSHIEVIGFCFFPSDCKFASGVKSNLKKFLLSESAKSDVYSIKTLMVKNCFILICYLQSKDGRPLPARDRRALKQFEERLRTLRKRERRLEFIENSWWTKFCGALRPLKVNGVLQNYAVSLCSTSQRD